MNDLATFEERLGLAFTDKNLLREALTHRSYLNEHPEADWSHNERLEFLGDAVLELVVTRALFDQFAEAPEGDLTNWRAALVRTEMLASVAEEMGLNDVILLSHGEARSGGRAKEQITANAVEALIGALYLDQGMDAARSLVQQYIVPQLPEIIEKGLAKDAKSRFQEEAQERTGVTPTYEVIDAWGPDHAKQFRVAVMLDDEQVAEGEGASKQEAQQHAASAALRAKEWDAR